MSASDCIFCKVVSGKIPATALHRDERVLAIADVNPQAPVHLLVMPIEHTGDIGTFSEEANAADVAHLMAVAAKLGREHGVDGYRLVINTGDEGGQTVGHLHVHVLAGRHMNWPPG